jgi:hypothetical protein
VPETRDGTEEVVVVVVVVEVVFVVEVVVVDVVEVVLVLVVATGSVVVVLVVLEATCSAVVGEIAIVVAIAVNVGLFFTDCRRLATDDGVEVNREADAVCLRATDVDVVELFEVVRARKTVVEVEVVDRFGAGRLTRLVVVGGIAVGVSA